MAKYKSFHIYKTTVNLLKRFMLEGETYDEAINRLLDMEDAVTVKGFTEKEYYISYDDVQRAFKVKFESNGVHEILFFNPATKEWSIDPSDWNDLMESNDNKPIVKYLVKFMEDFVNDSKNFILLEMMGDSMNFGDVVVRRVG